MFLWVVLHVQAKPAQLFCTRFQYSCAVTSPEACCSSWTCIVTWPLASNLNVMVLKLALVEWKPWKVQKMLTEEKWPWRVWYEDTVKGLISPHASCKVHSCLPCPASLFWSLIQRDAEFIWLLVILHRSCGHAVHLRVSFTAAKGTGYFFWDAEESPQMTCNFSREIVTTFLKAEGLGLFQLLSTQSKC